MLVFGEAPVGKYKLRRRRSFKALMLKYRFRSPEAPVRAPWGWHGIIKDVCGVRIKELVVLPGQATSLQKHHFREEYWLCMSGHGEARVGHLNVKLRPGKIVYVPIGAVHRLANDCSMPLRLIETQIGRRLSESDIVRYEDRYGRVVSGAADAERGAYASEGLAKR